MLLHIPIGDGCDDVIEVEVDQPEIEGVELAADDGAGVVGRAPYSLAEAVGRVTPAIETVLRRLRAVATPDEISMELGLTLGGETGVIFAKGTAEATFAVTVTWRRDSTAAATGPAATGSTDAGRAGPAPTHAGPASTEPASTEPASTEPASTEPASTGPASTGPASTEPASTGPAETAPAGGSAVDGPA